MLAVVLSLAALAASSPQIDAAKLAACKPAMTMPAAGQGRAETPRRLGDLPPAGHELAVLRKVGACWVASVVRYDPFTHERTVTYEPAGPAQTQVTRTQKIPGF